MFLKLEINFKMQKIPSKLFSGTRNVLIWSHCWQILEVTVGITLNLPTKMFQNERQNFLSSILIKA